jgi:membrane-associated protease RseP (regulator of RpoE activity)
MQMTAQQMLRSIALTAALSAVGGIGGAAVRHVSGSDQSAPVLSPAPVARIPFRSLGGLILVPVRINGSRELSMILDTGMSSPVVVLMHRELGDELKLSGGRPVQVGGAGGQVAPEGLLYGGVIATLGGVEQPALTAIVMSESRDASEWVQDGIIGKSVFDRYIADIDYEASVLSLYEPESFEAKGFESVPLSFDHAFPTLEAKVENEAGRTIPVRLVLDLGAGHALSLHADSTRHLTLPARTMSSVIGKGVQGEIEGRVGRIPGLRVGSFALRGIVSTFAGKESGVTCASQGAGADGNLGSQFLRRFRVVMDYPHRRMLLAPRPGYDRPFEHNMAGLALRWQRNGGLAVRSVIDDSPAAEAGIALGDRILAVDGKTLDAGGPVDVSELFQSDGATLRLTVERGGTRSERLVRLRRMI